ncbi:MAG TPA: zinc ribbon domain-containing protein [Vicinamibacteria bacterium]|nr:zinc ribbon domain-containing protein [Vicinamibacteria bacterium]
MEAKKKLIGRLAMAAGAVLGLALVVVAATALIARAEREDRARRAVHEREQLVERSRKYVGELAQRVDRLPVDAGLVGEVESRYFEEYSAAPMQVWAMGTDGSFLFGVPRESFDKLNAIYDHEVAPKLSEGVFIDRQTFLRTLADSSEEIGPASFAPKAGERRAETDEETGVWDRWRHYGHDPSRSFVVSAPVKSPTGAALGSVYLKREIPWPHGEGGNDLREVADAAGVVAGFTAAFLWLLLPTWVYVDARGRGVRRAWLFAFLTAMSGPVGLIVYLIARPERPLSLQCPGCGREVDGGAFCPHCGRDLSTAFCATCRYPLKPEWSYCPACRGEIRPQPSRPEAPAPSAQPAG